MKVLSYNELVAQEDGKHVQRGMNFGIMGSYSIVLMSTERNAPYNDKMLDDGIIEYEGHDAPASREYDKKKIDQPFRTSSGKLTENGKFFTAVDEFKSGVRQSAKVKVFRKIRPNVWVDMGLYDLVDCYIVSDGNRNVFKFVLKPDLTEEPYHDLPLVDLAHNRQIPGDIQCEVYERDEGKCRICGASDNLHFDHIIPFSKGGSSKVSSNIQLLCARHNLQKGAKFQ